MRALCLPKCLKAFGQSDLFKRMSFEEFQDSHHLGYWKGKILANVNLHNTMMSQTKFQLNLTTGSKRDVV